MNDREQVLARIERELDRLALTSILNGPQITQERAAPWSALRRIIEAHECREVMRMRPGGGEGIVHECRADCPVALAAQEIGE